MATITSLVRAVALAIASILVVGAVPASPASPLTGADSSQADDNGRGRQDECLGPVGRPGPGTPGHAAVVVPTVVLTAVASETGAMRQHLLPSSPVAIDGRPFPAAAPVASAARPVAATTKKATHTATTSVAPRPAAPVRAAAPAALGSFGRLSIAGIGLSGSVDNWGCRGGTLPNRIERWGCAGTGNTYLMGHAYGVFGRLSSAYSAGRLQAGLLATVTTRTGTRTYRLAWARIVPASYSYRGMSGDQWAWNATGTPSLTLQTCWGASSSYRLIVRFVAVG